MSAYDLVLERVKPGAQLRTPDRATGQPFEVEAIDAEGVLVRTSKGGHVRMGLFAFEAAAKYLADQGCTGERWLEVKDPDFQMVLNAENDRVRAASYVLAILGAAGVIDVDGGRPNKVRLASD